MAPALLSLSLLAGFVIEHIDYGPDAKQRIDVVRRDEAKGLPVVVFLHGGVWQMGDRAQYAHVGTAFAGRGFVAVTASYRLAPRHRWPAQIEDAAAVVALVKANAAKWGGDPEKIFLVGHSAGAQLAMMLLYDPAHLAKHKLTPKDIDGVVAISGVFDLRAPLDEDQDDGGFARFIAPVFGADVKALRAASPLDVVRKTGTPLLFITSTGDYVAMRTQTEQMARALALLGEQVPVVVVDGPDHFALVSQIGQPGDKVTEEVTRFLRR
ncbi:MAG: alpha/beta hydrolase [Deltaproteobacteria bacterium]|nr:alpha/beta hydrolase [Deltaproteobacteria bacterium]